MKKDIFEEIEVPSFEAKHAIKKGIQRGVDEQKEGKSRTARKIIKIFIPIAASIVLVFSLGFVSEPIAQAVSNIPIIGDTLGGFYEQYASEHGSNENLPAPEQIEEMSLVATDQGITVEITGAYNYQNGTIGIFFEATGDINNEDEIFFEGPDNTCEYYLFDHEYDYTQEGTDVYGYSFTLDGFNKVGETYVGNIVIDFHDNDYPETIETIPLTFTSMCAKEGEWSFVIPVIDEPNTVDLDAEQSGHGVTIHYDSIYLGGETSSLYFTVTDSIESHQNVIDFGIEDSIHFTITDDNGEEIPITSMEIQSASGYSDGSSIYVCELTLSNPISASCESITVNVELETETGEKMALDPVQLDTKR